ncbi:MAG TPA: hypothetical protein VHR45_05070 [Thermoanaerobaculia bacterium]|nr:hypothetical protein [Thermoanaerobaculia bacterium]
MPYTRDGIMAQIYVAFGQGTGPLRVSQATCVALHDQYYQRITETVLEQWDREAVHVLERIRAIGRLMALQAGTAGQTTLVDANLKEAATSVETQSLTAFCGPPPPASTQ